MPDGPDLLVKRGDTWTWVYPVVDPDGEPIPLTGATARLQVRGARDVLIADYSDQLVVGETEISLDVEHQMPLGLFEFDIELTFPDGTVSSTQTMAVEVVRDITRASE